MVDIIQVLTQQNDYQKARKYWNKLKERLILEGNQSVTNCHHLKFMAKDGKYYITDSANIETMFRLVQSVPSPKAEPLKLWLAKKGGQIAKNARLELEQKTGKKVISAQNFLELEKNNFWIILY